MANTVVFKLLHTPTGLFATSADSKYTEHSLTRLSVDGKVFIRKPKAPDGDFGIVYPRNYYTDLGYPPKSVPEDWKVVSYELVEIK